MKSHIILVSESDFNKLINGGKTAVEYTFGSEVKPQDQVRIRCYFTQPSNIITPEIEAIVVKVDKVATKTRGLFNYNLGLNIQLIMF